MTAGDRKILTVGLSLAIVGYLAAWIKAEGFGMLQMSDQLLAGNMFRWFLAKHWAVSSALMPGWMPYQFAGMPYVDGFHGSLLYPPGLLFPGVPDMIALGAALVVALAGVYLWPRYFLHGAIAAYVVVAHVPGLLIGSPFAAFYLSGWIGGYLLVLLIWRCGGNRQPGRVWNLLAGEFMLIGLLVVYSPWTPELSHGYALDAMADFVKTADAATGIAIVGDGKPWAWWHWITNPLWYGAGFAALFGTRRPV